MAGSLLLLATGSWLLATGFGPTPKGLCRFPVGVPYNWQQMQPASRHQCLIYNGAPNHHLRALAATACERLGQNYRCLYLNSTPMVAGMRSYLAAAGVDVTDEMAKNSLILTSELHLGSDGRFDADRMMDALSNALEQALVDGYDGLWATGDMTWEFGPAKDFGELLEYEWKLEDFFHRHSEMSGICQYHADTLPHEVLRKGVLTHSATYVNETLSMINPCFLPRESFTDEVETNKEVDLAIARLFDQHLSI